MKKLIQAIIDKYFCLHDWKLEYEANQYETATSKLPYKIKRFYICTKCGKVQKIDI